jgi:hypothetical protein
MLVVLFPSHRRTLQELPCIYLLSSGQGFRGHALRRLSKPLLTKPTPPKPWHATEKSNALFSIIDRDPVDLS